MPRLSLLLALAALTACGPSDPAGSPGSTAAPSADGEALPDTSMVREVSPESTLDLVSGSLAAASPSVAIQTVDLWIARLDTVSTADVAELRDDLEALRNQLQSSPIDGRGVGRTLGRLADGTAALAEPGTALDRLAQTLRQQSARLAPDPTGSDSTAADVAGDVDGEA